MTRRKDATRGAPRGPRRSPDPDARTLDPSGVFGGPEFIGRRLGAIRRMRGFAAILRGGLLRRQETCRRQTAEGESNGVLWDADRHDGRSGRDGMSRRKG